MDTQKVKKKVGFLDHEILKLINERMEVILRAGATVSEKTLDRVLPQLRSLCDSHKLLRKEFAEALIKQIVHECEKLLKDKPRLIGFQGEHGAYGEVAARLYDDNLVPVPCPQFQDVFCGVENQELDLGIVPVQNSLGGAVSQIHELLMETDLKVAGAVKLGIDHCLLAHPDADYREIRLAFSHPQALSQCRDFLERHRLQPRPYYDTAGAARMIAKENPPMSAAIASPLCADLYNLDIIKKNIADHPSNITRFLILARQEETSEADKCSIIFATDHRAGALFAVLKIFADRRINLTRIESFPDRQHPGRYVFFLDFQIDESHPETEPVLSAVKKNVRMLKMLGRYREEDPDVNPREVSSAS